MKRQFWSSPSWHEKLKVSPWVLDYQRTPLNYLFGEIVTQIQKDSSKDGIIINAGAYTHTSIAIADAISAIKAPVIEVHISNILAREEFRHKSFLSPVCKGSLFGFGLKGYELALYVFQSEN